MPAFFGFAAVIYQREERDSFRLQNIFEFFDGLVHGVIAGPVDDSVICSGAGCR